MASPPELKVILSSNRLRALQGLVDHAIAQHADVVSLDLDDVAGLEVTRRIEPRAGASRRSRDDDVAGHQRREGRNIIDEVAETEDQAAGAIVLPPFAIDASRQPNVGDLGLAGVGDEPRSKA